MRFASSKEEIQAESDEFCYERFTRSDIFSCELSRPKESSYGELSIFCALVNMVNCNHLVLTISVFNFKIQIDLGLSVLIGRNCSSLHFNSHFRRDDLAK